MDAVATKNAGLIAQVEKLYSAGLMSVFDYNRGLAEFSGVEKPEARVKGLFAHFDKENTKALDLKHFQAMVTDLCEAVSEELLGKMFSHLDTDKDGLIAYPEFKAWLLPTNPKPEAERTQIEEHLEFLRFKLNSPNFTKLLTGNNKPGAKQAAAASLFPEGDKPPSSTVSCNLKLGIGEVKNKTVDIKISHQKSEAAVTDLRKKFGQSAHTKAWGVCIFDLKEGPQTAADVNIQFKKDMYSVNVEKKTVNGKLQLHCFVVLTVKGTIYIATLMNALRLHNFDHTLQLDFTNPYPTGFVTLKGDFSSGIYAVFNKVPDLKFLSMFKGIENFHFDIKTDKAENFPKDIPVPIPFWNEILSDPQLLGPANFLPFLAELTKDLIQLPVKIFGSIASVVEAHVCASRDNAFTWDIKADELFAMSEKILLKDGYTHII